MKIFFYLKVQVDVMTDQYTVYPVQKHIAIFDFSKTSLQRLWDFSALHLKIIYKYLKN